MAKIQVFRVLLSLLSPLLSLKIRLQLIANQLFNDLVIAVIAKTGKTYSYD